MTKKNGNIMLEKCSSLAALEIIEIVKRAVSYRFSQGLLTLMCNNSKLKADINLFFFLLRRQTSKVYYCLQKFTIQHPVALL